MKRAKYTIEFHDRSGPCRSVGFEGTRHEARVEGRELIDKDLNGNAREVFRIHFHRYI